MATPAPDALREARLALLHKADASLKAQYADLLRLARIPQAHSDASVASEGAKLAVASENMITSVEQLLALVRQLKMDAVLAVASQATAAADGSAATSAAGAAAAAGTAAASR